MNISDSYTNREAFRLFDPLVVVTLAPERIERLLDMEDQILAIDTAPISDAICQYPEEEFLEEIRNLILELKETTLEELPIKIDEIADKLTKLEDSTIEETKAGVEQLEKLGDALEKIGDEV